MDPYVQDVNMWVEYYTKGISSNKQNTVSDADSSALVNSGSLSEPSNISVTQVEPKGPLPHVPLTGVSTGLRTVSPSQAAVQQANMTAQREKLASAAIKRGVSHKRRGSHLLPSFAREDSKKSKPSNSNIRASKSPGRGRGKHATHLTGTPQDIFNTIKASASQDRKKTK